jgi:chromosome segregation ATPase
MTNLLKSLDESMNKYVRDCEKYKIQVQHLSAQLELKSSECVRNEQELCESRTEWQEKCTSLKTRCGELSTLCDDLQRKLNVLEAELDTCKRSASETNEQHELKLNELISSKAQSEKLLANVEIECENLKLINHELNNQIEMKATSLNDLNNKLIDAQQMISSKNSEYEKLSKALSEQTATNERECNDLRTQLKIKVDELSQSSRTLETEYENKLASMRLKHSEELNKQLSNCRMELDTLKQNIDAERQQLANIKCDAENKCHSLQLQLATANQLVDQLNSEKRMLNDRMGNVEATYAAQLDTCKRELEVQCSKLREEYLTSFNLKQNECEQLKMSLEQANKASKQTNSQLVNELESLKKENQSLVHNLEVQMNNVSKHIEFEKEQHAVVHKRLRDELTNKQAELDSLRTKHKQELEEQINKSRAELNEQLAANTQLRKLYDEEKQAHTAANEIKVKLFEDVADKSKQLDKHLARIRELEQQNASIKEYANKFESHYQLKKTTFNETELKNKELNERIIKLDAEARALREENNCYMEKIKTVNYENSQLRAQKDMMTRKLNEMPLPSAVDSLDFASYQSNNNSRAITSQKDTSNLFEKKISILNEKKKMKFFIFK